MADMLTITLNPALDMSTSVARVVPEEKLRCAAPVYDPGGGGINVARAVRLLGGRAEAFVALGGYRGEQLADLLRAEGVAVLPFAVAGETRVSLAVRDEGADAQYRFVMPGPVWDADMAGAVLSEIETVMDGGLVVLSGSQPDGVPVAFPAQLAAMVAAKGARLILDTSGAPLAAFVQAGIGVDVLRLDHAESEALAGRALPEVADVAGFAQSLVARGVARAVVLARGSHGSVLANEEGCWRAVTPEVPVVSKVGAGDSFVGAFTLALARGAADEQALRHGVAAASAAVMSEATDLCRAADARALLDTCQVQAIPA
ncbi:MAG TPA: 1-phosphofructokinase family hexose kinase [Aliiroseovarius sp.]|nr:1-phosphofructokinase family hexose kinase [Aliiroseovarius sp.]